MSGNSGAGRAKPTKDRWASQYVRTSGGAVLHFVPYAALRMFAVFSESGGILTTLYDGADLKAACAAFGEDVSGHF